MNPGTSKENPEHISITTGCNKQLLYLHVKCSNVYNARGKLETSQKWKEKKCYVITQSRPVQANYSWGLGKNGDSMQKYGGNGYVSIIWEATL